MLEDAHLYEPTALLHNEDVLYILNYRYNNSYTEVYIQTDLKNRFDSSSIHML